MTFLLFGELYDALLWLGILFIFGLLLFLLFFNLCMGLILEGFASPLVVALSYILFIEVDSFFDSLQISQSFLKGPPSPLVLNLDQLAPLNDMRYEQDAHVLPVYIVV